VAHDFDAVGCRFAAGGDDRAQKWRDFPVFVWFHGGPEQGREAFATLCRAGLAGCNIEAAWESSRSAAARAAGVEFYVDHLAGKGDLWLRPARFDRDRDAWKDDRAGFRPSRPTPLCDRSVRSQLLEKVHAGLARHRDSAPLAWVLEDELSVTRGVNPMDYCFAPTTLEALRGWLESRCGAISEWNARHGGEWSAWSEFVPPTTAQARQAADGRPVSEIRLAAWSLHREFMDEALRRLLVELAAPVAAADPGVPVGFTGGGFPSAYGGFDWARLAPALTLHEPYDTGAAPELVHSFKGADARVLSTLFVPDAPDAAWAPRELLARVARGDDGVVVWSTGPILSSDGTTLTAAGRRLADETALARRVRRELDGCIDSPPQVFLFSGMAAARAGWMVDSWGDGGTFPNRLTSYEAEHSSTASAREGWVELLRGIGVPFAFFDERAGLPDAAVLAPARATVVLTEAYALSERLVAQLAGFVAAGGTLLGDAHAALFDEELAGRDSAALEALFGVRRSDRVELDDLAASVAIDAQRTGALRLAIAEGEWLEPAEGTSRTPVGFARATGKGRSLYLDRRIGGCVRGPGREEALRATASALAGWLGGRNGTADVAGAIEPDSTAIGALHLRRLQRRGGELLLVVPAPSLTERRVVRIERRQGAFGAITELGSARASQPERAPGVPASIHVEMAPGGALLIDLAALPERGEPSKDGARD
jgi:hypothetical protein